jgi:hypothetical protein
MNILSIINIIIANDTDKDFYIHLYLTGHFGF